MVRGSAVGVEDYDVNKVWHSPDGFDAYGLVSPSGDPPVLDIRGTQLSSITDVFNDANPNGIGYQQFIDNRTTVDAWLSAVSTNGQRPDITGHSLGGALTQWFAANYTETPGALLGRIVTFNSPGISATEAAEFNPSNTLGVMHYIDSGDIVSLAGQAFIAGSYTIFTYQESDLNPIDYVMDKHCRPMLVASYLDADGTTVWTRPTGLTNETFSSVSWLNDPTFAYTDPQSLCFVAAVSVVAPNIGPNLLLRGTVESVRQNLGQRWIRRWQR